jgi:hypothetical protein
VSSSSYLIKQTPRRNVESIDAKNDTFTKHRGRYRQKIDFLHDTHATLDCLSVSLHKAIFVVVIHRHSFLPPATAYRGMQKLISQCSMHCDVSRSGGSRGKRKRRIVITVNALIRVNSKMRICLSYAGTGLQNIHPCIEVPCVVFRPSAVCSSNAVITVSC